MDAIRETDASREHAAAIFYYGTFPEAEERLTEQGVRLHRLCTWRDVLEIARAEARFDPGTLAEVDNFIGAPCEWQQARTGA